MRSAYASEPGHKRPGQSGGYRFLNLNYESKDRVLIFDLISTCEFLKINDVHYLVFGSRKTSGRAFIALNEKYMVARVVGSTDGASTLPTETFLYTDDEIASAHKSGEREREACVTKLMSMPSTSGFEECRFPWTLVRKPADPELGDFIYFAAVSKIATETSVLRLECLEEHLKIDRLQGQVFARCQHNMGGGGTDPRSYMTLTGGAVDGQHFEVSFVCPCFGFDIRNPRFVTKNKVQFELLANSGTLEMGSFTVALKGDKPPLDRAPGASRGTYVMAISDGGVALSLAPVEIAAN